MKPRGHVCLQDRLREPPSGVVLPSVTARAPGGPWRQLSGPRPVHQVRPVCAHLETRLFPYLAGVSPVSSVRGNINVLVTLYTLL